MNVITNTSQTTSINGYRARPIGSWRLAYGRTIALLRQFEPYLQSALLLWLRLLYGWFFVQTGYGKLMNFERVIGYFETLSLPAPQYMAAFVAITELVGGVMLIFGIGTRVSAAILSVVMVGAYLTAHADEAFVSLEAFTEQTPFPFLVASLVIMTFGAGKFSIDGWMRYLCDKSLRSDNRVNID